MISCYHHRQFILRDCEFAKEIIITRSSCVFDFERHIAMLSSYHIGRLTIEKSIENLSIPNEDFGRRNKRWNQDFEGSTFQGREYSIWATNHWKVLRKSWFHHLFLLPQSSFGRVKSAFYVPQTRILERFPIPNEDLGEQKVWLTHRQDTIILWLMCLSCVSLTDTSPCDTADTHAL